jgi:hypothetical protein
MNYFSYPFHGFSSLLFEGFGDSFSFLSGWLGYELSRFNLGGSIKKNKIN